MVFFGRRRFDEPARKIAHDWLRSRLSQRAVCVSKTVPPVPRSRILPVRADTGLAADHGMGLRAAYVSSRPQRWLSRALRWRLAAGHVALDAGLSAGRPAFLASGPPSYALRSPFGRAASQCRRW